jgi:hypothetical protein
MAFALRTDSRFSAFPGTDSVTKSAEMSVNLAAALLVTQPHRNR